MSDSMKNSAFVKLASIMVLTGGFTFAQLPVQKVLTMDLAQEIARAGIDQCRQSGYHVSVLVVDNTNTPKAVLRDDGAPLATLEVATMKAKTVLAFGRASGPPANAPQ